MKRPLLLGTFVASACTTIPTSIPIAYQLRDSPEQQRVELTYRNTLRRELCLSPHHWPNEGGKISWAQGSVALVVDGQRFPLEDFNTGYCFGGCPIRVAPGKAITGFLRYEDFNLPAELMNRPKSLDFSPTAIPCAQMRNDS